MSSNKVNNVSAAMTSVNVATVNELVTPVTDLLATTDELVTSVTESAPTDELVTSVTDSLATTDELVTSVTESAPTDELVTSVTESAPTDELVTSVTELSINRTTTIDESSTINKTAPTNEPVPTPPVTINGVTYNTVSIANQLPIDDLDESMAEKETDLGEIFLSEDTINCCKIANEEEYEIMEEGGTVQTLEGLVKYDAGAYMMTGPKGEKYPITKETFSAYKTDLGNGRCVPNALPKVAKLVVGFGCVKTSWGSVMNYNQGEDVIVRHGPGDYGIVKLDIFKTTYCEILDYHPSP